MCKDFRGIQKTALKDQLTHEKTNDSRKMSQKKKEDKTTCGHSRKQTTKNKKIIFSQSLLISIKSRTFQFGSLENR